MQWVTARLTEQVVKSFTKNDEMMKEVGSLRGPEKRTNSRYL